MTDQHDDGAHRSAEHDGNDEHPPDAEQKADAPANHAATSDGDGEHAPAAAPNNAYKSLTAATGTANDDPGGSGLAQVTGLLFRYANGSTPAGYWNGTTWTGTYSSANELATTGGANWRLAFPTLAQGSYSFSASATDRAGNVKRSSTLIFIIDHTAPTTRVTTPAAAPNNTFTSLARASGTATENFPAW